MCIRDSVCSDESSGGYKIMGQVKEEQIIDILKKCYDPELPVDLWNLGLIYSIQIQEAYDESKSDVNIVMSLTTPGCTMGGQMSDDIKSKLESLDEVNQAFVEVTFDPPWTPEMITDEAKEKLGLNLSEPQDRKEPIIDTEWE